MPDPHRSAHRELDLIKDEAFHNGIAYAANEIISMCIEDGDRERALKVRAHFTEGEAAEAVAAE